MRVKQYAKAPEVGDYIIGNGDSFPMPGKILNVKKHITADGFDHWIVVEDFYEREIRVKREKDGNLYECRIVTNYND